MFFIIGVFIVLLYGWSWWMTDDVEALAIAGGGWALCQVLAGLAAMIIGRD